MSQSRFYMWLVITALASGVLSYFTMKGIDTREIQKASYLLIAFFIFFTVVVFMFSRSAIQSTNPYLFTRVFMVSISLKIVLLAMLVIGCIKFLQIKPKELIGPLLSSYLLFTILETWVLMKLSKNN